MSCYWTPYCVTCDAEGPHVRSGMSDELKFVVGGEHVTSTAAFKDWLDAHRWHDVRLIDESTPRGRFPK